MAAATRRLFLRRSLNQRVTADADRDSQTASSFLQWTTLSYPKGEAEEGRRVGGGGVEEEAVSFRAAALGQGSSWKAASSSSLCRGRSGGTSARAFIPFTSGTGL